MANEVAKKDTAKKRFQLKAYLKEMWGEVKKLSWLSRKDLIKNTAMVLVFVLVMSLVIYLLDMAFSAGVKGLSNVTAPAAVVETETAAETEATTEAAAETPAETEATAEPAAAEATAEPAAEEPTAAPAQ